MSDSHPASHKNRPHIPRKTLAVAGATASLTLAPTILPSLGIGDPFLGEDANNLMHVHEAVEATKATASFGTGLAGIINSGISSIPFIGETLVSNSYASIAATAIIGIGGVLFANWLEKREDGTERIAWSGIIRKAALCTSILIALPAILTGISTGLTYLGLLVGVETGSAVAGVMTSTLGAAAGHSSAVSILGATLPHLFICGFAIIPLVVASFLGKKAPEEHAHAEATANVQLVSATAPQVGKPCQLAFRIRDAASGKPLTADDIAVTHTKKLHTMVVDQSLSEYHHIHPDFDPATGLWVCQFTPQLPHKFFAWHDFTPTTATSPIYQRTDILSPGTYSIPPRLLPTSRASAGGLSISLTANPPLASGRDSMLHVMVRDANGQPVNDLEPVMGAYGHLAGFSADGGHFIHSHPMTELSEPIKNGALDFHISPGQAGMTKFFLQLRYQGREVILPFAQAIANGKLFGVESDASAHQHHQAARA